MPKTKADWKSFKVAFPEKLRPIFDFLQAELDRMLSDTSCRQKIESINPFNDKGKIKHEGYLWLELHHLFSNDIKTWDIPNKAWYARILYHNICHEIQAKAENVLIWDVIKRHESLSQEALDSIHALRLYPSYGLLNNLLDSSERPELARHKTFVLDFSTSDKQMFTMDKDLLCQIKIAKTEWLPYQIILPHSIMGNLTGKFAKPRFSKDSDGNYYGVVSYQYEPEVAVGHLILGVDLGKIKYYTATAVDPKTGWYSSEYNPSSKLTNLNKKLNKLYQEKALLQDKINRAKRNNSKSVKNVLRNYNLSAISIKIEQLKHEMARLSAREIVELAKQLGCSEIHLEDLTWLKSTGGKWNFREIQNWIKQKSVEAGVKVVMVNASKTSSTNPQTSEVGAISGRLVHFLDGFTIDRDYLASINIALRNKKESTKRLRAIKKNTVTPKRVRKPSRKRKIRELISYIKDKRNTQIVVLRPCAPSTWFSINRVYANSSLLHKTIHFCQFC